MRYNMQGKVALVTGGGQGIMKQTAILYAKEGVKVVIAEIDEETGRITADEIRAFGGDAVFIQCNASKEDALKAAVDLAVSTYGALNYALNGVGISHDFCPITEVSSDSFRNTYETNVSSLYFGLKYQIPAMLISGGGSIVNIASTAGMIATALQGSYPATKAAVIGMTKSAAVDFAQKGIRINCVCPGPVASPNMEKYLAADPHFADQFLTHVPMNRLLRPAEIAEVIVFLCSDYASAMTGAIIPVDGGTVA